MGQARGVPTLFRGRVPNNRGVPLPPSLFAYYISEKEGEGVPYEEGEAREGRKEAPALRCEAKPPHLLRPSIAWHGSTLALRCGLQAPAMRRMKKHGAGRAMRSSTLPGPARATRGIAKQAVGTAWHNKAVALLCIVKQIMAPAKRRYIKRSRGNAWNGKARVLQCDTTQRRCKTRQRAKRHCQRAGEVRQGKTRRRRCSP